MKEIHLMINVNTVDVEKLNLFYKEVNRLNIAVEKDGIFYCDDKKAKEFNDLFYQITIGKYTPEDKL